MVIQISVDAKMFRAVAMVQSTEETRYYLNGVFISPHPEGGALLVATDGYRLMVAHDRDGRCEKPAIIQLPKNAIPVSALKVLEPPRLEIDADGFASLGQIFKSAESTFIDGAFPDWPRVLYPILEGAKKKKFGAASFNATYISEFGEIAAALDFEKSVPLRIFATSESEPALILFPRTPDAFGVLMPMRAEIGNAFPAFMQPILEPKKATKKPAKETDAA